MKTIVNSIILMLLMGIQCACSENDNESVHIDPDSVLGVPKVTSFSPEKGPFGTQVTITGEGFGTDANKVEVFFNDLKTTAFQLSEDKIVAEVPKGALSGQLVIHIDGEELLAGSFMYELTVGLKLYTGNGQGLENGPLEAAKFNNPTDMAEDSHGNLYVTDSGNNLIRKISPEGIVSTYAGNLESGDLDGSLVEARFNFPGRIAIDNSDNIYITDFYNNSLRKIRSDGNVTTLVKTKFNNSAGVRDSLNLPTGIAVGEDGVIYLGDGGHDRILRVDPEGGVTHLAGSGAGFDDGHGFLAQFNFPTGMTMGSDGYLYLADLANNSIRKVSSTGAVTTVAGNGAEGDSDGNTSAATFAEPMDVVMDADGNLFVSDAQNYSIRKINNSGDVTTLGRNTNEGDNITLLQDDSAGLFIDSLGTLYVIETDGNRINRVIFE